MQNYLTEDEIKKELDDYIYKVSIKYAVLLNVSWGSGKTHFIEEYIKNLEEKYELNKKDKTIKYKKPVYVSLYGLSNISEIKNKIALSLIKNKKIKQLMPVLDVGIEIGSDLVSKNTFIQNSDSKLNRIIKAFHKIDK